MISSQPIEQNVYASYNLEGDTGHYVGHASVQIMDDAQFDALDWFLDSGASAQPARIAELDFWYEVENVEDSVDLYESYEYVCVVSDVIVLISVFGRATTLTSCCLHCP